jgi:hypothetical protein
MDVFVAVYFAALIFETVIGDQYHVYRQSVGSIMPKF